MLLVCPVLLMLVCLPLVPFGIKMFINFVYLFLVFADLRQVSVTPAAGGYFTGQEKYSPAAGSRGRTLVDLRQSQKVFKHTFHIRSNKNPWSYFLSLILSEMKNKINKFRLKNFSLQSHLVKCHLIIIIIIAVAKMTSELK
jgi:hypothetical protein